MFGEDTAQEVGNTGELLNKVSYAKVNTNAIPDFLTREPGKTNQ